MEIGKINLGKMQTLVVLLTIIASIFFVSYIYSLEEKSEEFAFDSINSFMVTESVEIKYVWDGCDYSTSPEDVKAGNSRLAKEIYVNDIESFLSNCDDAVEFQKAYRGLALINRNDLMFVHGAIIEDEIYLKKDYLAYGVSDFEINKDKVVVYYKMDKFIFSLIGLAIIVIFGSFAFTKASPKKDKPE